MTCGYMRDVATASTWTFFKLLFRWNGSVWKAIHTELILWLFLYVNIRTIYEFFLVDTEAAHTFEHIVLRCREISGKCRTVMTFAIGFFVTYVSNRWWNIFMTIPWPDTCALQLTAYLRGRGQKFEKEDKSFRQNIMRYLWLSYVLVFRDVSVRIKKRFPTIESLTPTLLNEEELGKLKKHSKDMRHWVPIEWAMDYLRTARRRCLIDEFHYVEINETMLNYRQQLHEILSHDSITVPLVYVQAVHICTLCYFLITCFSSQTIRENHVGWMGVLDFYLPIYTMIEFIVFVGWLKTAFVMLNPFGMDDDDFEMNVLIERNLMVSLSYINDFYDKPPKLVDMKVCLPKDLQTVVRENANPMHGSAVPVKVNKVQQVVLRNPQMVNLVNNVLPNPSATDLVTHRAMNEFIDFGDIKHIPSKDDDKWDKLQNPHNSTREDGGDTDKKYLWKEEELEKAVAKLMDKRLAEEKIAMLSPDSTQKSELVEEPTQKSWIPESEKVVPVVKKQSKLKPPRPIVASGSKQNLKERTPRGSPSRQPPPPPPQPPKNQSPATLPLLSPIVSPAVHPLNPPNLPLPPPSTTSSGSSAVGSSQSREGSLKLDRTQPDETEKPSK